MQRTPMTYRSALLFALLISVLMHVLFLIMFFYGRDAYVPPEGVEAAGRRPFDMWRIGYSFVQTFVLSFLLFAFNFRILKTGMSSRMKVALQAVGTLVVAITVSYVFSKVHIEIYGVGKFPERFIRGNMTRDIFLGVLVAFTAQIIYLSHRKQKMALENEMLLAENVKTRYEALKNQIDPHFLFNSLNTLNSIIGTDPSKAQEYVHQLSHVFRYTMQNRDTISLHDELEFTKAYCSLMQIRYGDSLAFVFDTSSVPEECLIIPLSIQTLVENAIKHNVITKKNPLTITVRAEGQSLTVSNPLKVKKETQPGEGIGLANIAERYRLLWNLDIEVVKTQDEFRVTVPLVKP